jgi:hypothetical protein
MDQRTQSEKITMRKEKQEAEEIKRAAKEKERKQAYLAREQVMAKASDSRQSQREEKRTQEEAKQLAREQARKRDYNAKEKTMVDAHEARKLRDKK